MAKLTEIIEAEPGKRFKRPDMDAAIGLHKHDDDGKQYLYWFQEGQPVHMLTPKQAQGMLFDNNDDWYVGNV